MAVADYDNHRVQVPSSGATGRLCVCGVARATATASFVILGGSFADLMAACMFLIFTTTGCRCSELSVVGLVRVRESSCSADLSNDPMNHYQLRGLGRQLKLSR